TCVARPISIVVMVSLRIWCWPASGLVGRQAGGADRADMPVVGAAAAADHAEIGQEREHARIALRQILPVADIEGRRVVELGMAHLRGVYPQPADPLHPRSAMANRLGEVDGVDAVDH